MKLSTRLLLVMVALPCALPVTASASTTQQIVQLRSADGRSVPALVTYPEGGPDTQAPVAIIHHGGPGGHPLRALSAARWAAQYFADRGYITISVLSRISRDVIDQPFGAGAADIQGAVDWAAQLSNGPLVLVGHSSGSVSSTLYMATTQDPRVKAIIHFAPTAGGSGWMMINMGKARYDAVVARLRQLVEQGRGDQPIYEDHHLAPPAPQSVTYGYLMSARTWLSWWGPESKNRNIALFPKIRVPMLMISGDADIFVSRAYQEELRQAATGRPRVDSIILEGGVPHEFTGAEIKAAALAIDWLTELGIRASPRVSTRVVDLKIGAEVRPGVIYEPADMSLRKPLALMLMPDFADDIMLSPLDALGPRLARAGFTVLIPQDRGAGWAFYRTNASNVSADQRAWLKYLAGQGQHRIVLVTHGLAGVMVPALMAEKSTLAGVVLIQPPTSAAQFARNVLGAEGYLQAVTDAEEAVKRGAGDTTMIIARYRDPAERKWITHLATGFLSFFGPSAQAASLAAPLPALKAAGLPVLLIDARQGRFLGREQQSTLAQGQGAASLWYEDVYSPLHSPDRLASDLQTWLDALSAPAKPALPSTQ